ncbi:trans-Golgi network-localized SYP41-interacting protein 1 isoform X3 [Amaranthus tricolor]|uniref:trans-Golgi network-localized SYP41-interacting protein 1 isoform X3 n=1 Tax=Amaranthus tricolor TaxID=29722 RepID=UPI00259051D0|nr:trans-Golgi network-localized SYP41-interacting protein 1 isoform X3 [Amaranthus tricolor]
MDKKSNRTDLLAAGRKKLQQYRQKKDNKGKDGKGKDGKSNSKSMGKADKSEQTDADCNLISSLDTANAESSQVLEPEVESSAKSLDSTIDSPKLSAEPSLNHKPDVNAVIGEGVVEISSLEVEGSVTSECTDFNTVLHQRANSAFEAAEMVATASIEPKYVLEGVQEADRFVLEPGRDEKLPVSIAISETTSPKKLNQQGEDVMVFPSDEKSFYLHSLNDSSYCEGGENRAHLDQKIVEGYDETDLPEVSSMVDIKSHNDTVKSNNDTHNETLCHGVKGNSLDLVQLAELLKGLSENDFLYLIKSRERVDHKNRSVHKNEMFAFPETFQEQFYLANISKDCFHLQLLEQHENQIDHDLDKGAELSSLLTDVQECKKRLGVELAQCRSELEVSMNEKLKFQNLYNAAKEESVVFSAKTDELKRELDNSVMHISSLSADLTSTKALLEASQVENEKLLKSLALVSEQRNKFEEVMQQYSRENQKLSVNMADSGSQLAALEQEVSNLKTSLSSMVEDRKRFEEENELHFHEKEMLLGDLADCRSEIAALQLEKSDFDSSLSILTKENKKLKDHEEFLAQEFERLSTELVVYQDQVSMQHQGNLQLEAELKEALLRLEQMAEENIILHSSLEIYKAKVAEIVGRQIQLSDVGTGSRVHIRTSDTGCSVETSEKEDTEISLSVGPTTGDVSDGTFLSELRSSFSGGDLVLKGYLEEADKIIQKLEKAVDGMHSHSVSLSRSYEKNAAAGVSKLIQAFESKTNVDDPVTDESPSVTESVGPLDPYFSVKDELVSLRNVLQALAQNVEHVDSLIMEEISRYKAAIISCRELEVEVEALKSMSNNLEARNIELEVICGAMNQHAHDTEAAKTQLEDLCEALKRQYAVLQSDNIELVKKLTDAHSRISGLQVMLNEIRQKSVELTSIILHEVENVQRGMREEIFSVERKWDSAFSRLAPMVQKLDTVVKSAVAYPLLHEMSQDLDIFGHFSSSVSFACEVINNLKTRHEAHDELSTSYKEIEEKLRNVDEARSLAIVLLQKFSSDIVNILNVTADHFNDGKIFMTENSQQDPLDASYYEDIIANLSSFLGDLLPHKELNKKLSSDLLNKANDIEELSKRCLDTDTLLKLALEVKKLLKVQDTEMDLNEAPVWQLQSSVTLLTQKYKELEEQAGVSVKDANSRLMELDDLQGKVESLNSVIIQQQNEIVVLRESLFQAKHGIEALQDDLLQKAKELEQSELRVASIREKLSIAVAKGKGLVVQRDNLKQSLAEMSSELERCSQESQLKDSRILEVEEKLKNYSEAGERMEALESELTYIRNSATALRESFLMKDSTLQRIEEILEDVELPDHFHSKDIIEKVDWLAKVVSGNPLQPSDWDQRSSVGGGSYSDTGFVVTDGGKDDVQTISNIDDDLKKKYEELQTKFYELAEQNDMLEQSLMERNILVQRWEEILDRINTPTQIRSMEPEERIHWLGTALSEADQHMRSLQQKIETLENYCDSLSIDLDESRKKIYELESSLEANLNEKEAALSEADDHMTSLQQKINMYENHCGSLSADLEDSRRRISELEYFLQTAIKDKEFLSCSLVTLMSDREIVSSIVEQYEIELDSLRKDVTVLQENLSKKCIDEGQINQIESDLKRLQNLILDAFQNSVMEEESPDSSNILVLERLIRKLVKYGKGRAAGQDSETGVWDQNTENVSRALNVTDVESEQVRENDVMDTDDFKPWSRVDEGQNIADLRRELAEALNESVSLREERDIYLQKIQSMVTELEELDKRKKELQELLTLEEQKSASLREKLNLAVRKGKSLVQQRDGLKQTVEEMTAEIDQLKSTISSHEGSLVESTWKISDLSLQIETCKAFEAENLSLKNHLIEAQQHLQQSSHTLSLLLSKLGEINAVEGVNPHDPLQKLDGIIKMCSDLHLSAASFEQESKKSKKSAELLLAELNEVQERNDSLQEELERAYDEISNLSKERDFANAAKSEALTHHGEISKEIENQLADLEKLKSSVLGLKNVFIDISTVCDDMFVKDIELLNNVRTYMESTLGPGVNPVPAKAHSSLVSVNSRFKDFWSKTSSWGNKMSGPLEESADLNVCKDIEQHLQQLTETISDLKERIQSHSMSLRTEVEWLSTVAGTMVREIASQKSSLESIRGDNVRLQSIEKEKDMEGEVMRRSIFLLFEACTTSIVEIENRKAQLVRENFVAENLRTNLPALPIADGEIFSGVALSSSEESVKTLADKLLMTVKDFVDIGTKNVEGHSKEMKNTIMELQKELQERDIQRERMCLELVSQIKAAEVTAANCSQDLQSMTNYAHDLENKVEVLKKDRSLLERRVGELEQECRSSTELEEKVKSLTDMLAGKEQEIESLMQALDEEENQMEALRSRILELEKALQKKNTDLELVEASRAKALKKLSVTVRKFDELHHMSEGLLSEIENLQAQLQERDTEISFLRQEVTKCTNDVLEAAKIAKERNSGELNDFLTGLDSLLSGVLKRNTHGINGNASYPEIKERVQKDLMSIISELEDMQLNAQSNDMLLQAERSKMEELLHVKEALEASLNEKERYLNSLQTVGISGLGTSEIVEVEPVLNKWPSLVTSSQVRSLRKANNDQVSIAIDADAGDSGRIEDEEDDKVHGFKSLTTSRFVPKFTRPVSDMIDGLWVSCDRTLMRQPAFRLGIMIYWAVLHAFLASFIV